MRFHGYKSVQEFIDTLDTTRQFVYEIKTYRQVRPGKYSLPEDLQNVTKTPVHGDPHSEVFLDNPDQVKVLIVRLRYPSPSSISTWDIFSDDLSALYADGINDTYQTVLDYWGFTEVK